EAFYTVRVRSYVLKFKLTIERYDKVFNMKTSEDIDLEADGNDLKYETTILFNNSLYVFGSYFDKKNEKLYAFKMDPATLNLDVQPYLVATIKSRRNSTFKFDLSDSENIYLSPVYQVWMMIIYMLIQLMCIQ